MSIILHQTSHSLNIIYRIRKTQAHLFVFDVDSSNDSQCSYTANSKYTRHGMAYTITDYDYTLQIIFFLFPRLILWKQKTVCKFM